MGQIFGYKIYDSIYPQMKIIDTPKFIFRPIDISDAKDIFDYLSQEKVVRYLPFEAHENLNDTKKFIKSYFINSYKKGKIGNYAIYYKKDRKVIGNVGFNNINPNSPEGELGICLNPKYWGHDFSTEFTFIAVVSGFEFSKVDKLVALTYEDNKYSTNCLENLRFNYIKTYKPKNSTEICHRFELNREEYIKMKKDYLPKLLKTFK